MHALVDGDVLVVRAVPHVDVLSWYGIVYSFLDREVVPTSCLIYGYIRLCIRSKKDHQNRQEYYGQSQNKHIVKNSAILQFKIHRYPLSTPRFITQRYTPYRIIYILIYTIKYWKITTLIECLLSIKILKFPQPKTGVNINSNLSGKVTLLE